MDKIILLLVLIAGIYLVFSEIWKGFGSWKTLFKKWPKKMSDKHPDDWDL